VQNYVPKIKSGHVVPDVPLDRIKDRLSLVKGSLVEAPLVGDFLSPSARTLSGANRTS
jgi:phospholipase D1/2